VFVVQIMKPFIAFLLSLSVLSCEKDNRSELSIKNAFCLRMIMQNERTGAKVIDVGGDSGAKQPKMAVENSEKLILWRNQYLRLHSRQNLLAYTDSVLTHFRNTPHTDSTIISEVLDSRRRLNDSNDSLDVLNLFYWTLNAEGIIHEDNLEQAGYYHGYISTTPCYINDSTFSPMDTVLLSVIGSFTVGKNEPNSYDFSNVKCINKNTNKVITPRIYRTGFIYVLIYIPHERGEYDIQGSLIVERYDGFQSASPLRTKFVVN
jgi:hypothetical protein